MKISYQLVSVSQNGEPEIVIDDCTWAFGSTGLIVHLLSNPKTKNTVVYDSHSYLFSNLLSHGVI